eukprot:513588-Rhodomonas_salina.1
MYQIHRNLFFVHQEKEKGAERELTGRTVVKKMSFMKYWMLDPAKKEYLNIISDPTNTRKDLLNLWQGFAAE